MFKIRDFSQLTRVSTKMLRHYDELGLLKPAFVDPDTQYRYYSADQLPRLNRIIALKDLGFSLDQIAHLLQTPVSSAELRGMLKLRQAEIERQLQLEQARLLSVEVRLRQIEQGERPNEYDVVVREVAPQLVAAIRQVVPTLGTPITTLFEALEQYVDQNQARAFRSPLLIFHDAEYREEALEVEALVPLLHAIPTSDTVHVYELPGATMACVVYTGGYDRMLTVLQTLLTWIETHQATIVGPIREVYVRFGAAGLEELNLPSAFLTDQSRLFVTEVQIPITQ
jgi:DNA-binding transcriptional MerR regulator